LPDVVIPDTIYNPLPLQCLAASALPEAVRQEIDGVLDRYSNAMSSPRLQPLLEDMEASTAIAVTSSAVLNEAGGNEVESLMRGDVAVNEDGVPILDPAGSRDEVDRGSSVPDAEEVRQFCGSP
jgi:hypothetical protein